MSRVLEILQPHCGTEEEWMRRPFAVELADQRFVVAVSKVAIIAIRSDEIAGAAPAAFAARNPVYLGLPPVGMWGSSVRTLLRWCETGDSISPPDVVPLYGVLVSRRLVAHVLGTIPGDAELLTIGVVEQPWPARVVVWTTTWRAVVVCCSRDAADIERLRSLEARRAEASNG